MKLSSLKIFVIIIVLSSILMAGSLVAVILSAIFVLAKGNIMLGISMVICFTILFIVSTLMFGMTISWKRSMNFLSKHTSDIPKQNNK